MAFESMSALNAAVDELSRSENDWSFLSAWSQSVDFFYEVNTAFSIVELQRGTVPESKTVCTHVTTSLTGLKIEHEELVDCIWSRASVSECVDSTHTVESAPWATKYDAANFISSAMVHEPTLPPTLEPLLVWMQKTSMDVSPQWTLWQRQSQISSPKVVLVRGRPVSSNALPNTVKLSSCCLRFEKVLVSKCRNFRVMFTIEGYGNSYSEAEQVLWSNPSYLARVSRCNEWPPLPEFHRTCGRLSEFTTVVDTGPCWWRDFGRDVTSALHTWSYYEMRTPGRFACSTLALLLGHAQEFMAGRYVSDSSDIFTHWGPMYSSEFHEDESDPAKPTSINTSGSMPRFYRVHSPQKPFVLRPKLFKAPTHPSHLVAADPSLSLVGQFFEERGYVDLGLSHLDLLGLECGLAKT